MRLLFSGWAHSAKYVTLFWTNFDPLPPSHFFTHLGTPPLKYVTHLGPPIFSSARIHTYDTYVLVYEGFDRGFCSGFFVWTVLSGVVFVCRPPFCQNTCITTE